MLMICCLYKGKDVSRWFEGLGVLRSATEVGGGRCIYPMCMVGRSFFWVVGDKGMVGKW